MRSVTDYVEGQGSGYVVRLERLDPAVDPALEREGYHSPATLYVVFGGGQVWADHDPHRLVREMPGSNRWLHEEFDRLRDRLVPEQYVEVDVDLDLGREEREAIRAVADRYGLTWDAAVSVLAHVGLEQASADDLEAWLTDRGGDGGE